MEANRHIYHLFQCNSLDTRMHKGHQSGKCAVHEEVGYIADVQTLVIMIIVSDKMSVYFRVNAASELHETYKLIGA